MRTGFRYQTALAFVVALSTTMLAPWARAQEEKRPDDATPSVTRTEQEDPDAKADGVEQDDPTARLAWERGAWGLVSPAFRANAMLEGKNHSDKKNAPGPKWVNIGPTGADYEQNGSFTGFVIDSGRARTILPHPTNPDIVYFLTSGGGLWMTSNFTASPPTWQPLTDGLVSTSGGSVAFGRTPSVLYLGLGDPFDVINVAGVMVKSIDGGTTWSAPFDLGNPFAVRDVKVDLSVGTTTATDIVLVATDAGLFRSADGGTSYSQVALGGTMGLNVWSIVKTSVGWLASA